MKKSKIVSAFFTAMLTLCITVSAAPTAQYNRNTNSVEVTDSAAPAGVKAAIVVFSPEFNMGTNDGIHYFGVQNVSESGEVNFTIPIEETSEYGNYRCKVKYLNSADTTTQWMLNSIYPSGNLGDIKLFTHIKNNDGTITARVESYADIHNKYTIFTAFYDADDNMISASVNNTFTASSEATDWINRLDNSAQIPSGAVTYRAFLWDGSTLNPAIANIKVDLN